MKNLNEYQKFVWEIGATEDIKYFNYLDSKKEYEIKEDSPYSRKSKEEEYLVDLFLSISKNYLKLTVKSYKNLKNYLLEIKLLENPTPSKYLRTYYYETIKFKNYLRNNKSTYKLVNAKENKDYLFYRFINSYTKYRGNSLATIRKETKDNKVTLQSLIQSGEDKYDELTLKELKDEVVKINKKIKSEKFYFKSELNSRKKYVEKYVMKLNKYIDITLEEFLIVLYKKEPDTYKLFKDKDLKKDSYLEISAFETNPEYLTEKLKRTTKFIFKYLV